MVIQNVTFGDKEEKLAGYPTNDQLRKLSRGKCSILLSWMILPINFIAEEVPYAISLTGCQFYDLQIIGVILLQIQNVNMGNKYQVTIIVIISVQVSQVYIQTCYSKITDILLDKIQTFYRPSDMRDTELIIFHIFWNKLRYKARLLVGKYLISPNKRFFMVVCMVN